MYNGIKFTNNSDIEKITEASFKILNDYGVLAEHESFAQILCDYSPDSISYNENRIRIKKEYARNYFLSFCNNASQNHAASQERQPNVSAYAELYQGYYLDPYDGKHKEWNEDRLLSYIKLAQRLPDIGSITMLGCPVKDFPVHKRPLVEKLYAFKYGTTNPSSIWDTALCSDLYKIWEIYADERKMPISDVFRGCVYFISPLKMGYVEAEQILWFRERGLKVNTGCMSSIGLGMPVTIAGALALHIAEQLFISIMHAALFGEKRFWLVCSLFTADMRSGSSRFGRPEQLLANNAISDIASFYSIPFYPLSGLSDAKLPSFEAGVQKLGTALAGIMKGYDGHIAAGLLSVDEVYSPVQMALDNEAAGYLKRICRGFSIDTEELALEAIKLFVNEDLLFIGQEHTARNINELWQPSIFSQDGFSGWKNDIDIDKARDIAISIMEGPPLTSLISENCEEKIRKVINET